MIAFPCGEGGRRSRSGLFPQEIRRTDEENGRCLLFWLKSYFVYKKGEPPVFGVRARPVDGEASAIKGSYCMYKKGRTPGEGSPSLNGLPFKFTHSCAF